MESRKLQIQILTIDGCPNAALAGERVAQAVASEGASADVEHVVVPTLEAARSLRFVGSPSVRINGEDVESEAQNRRDFGLTCRTYPVSGRLEGAPPEELIRAALRRRASHTEQDLASNSWISVLVWLLPIGALFLSGFFPLSTPPRAAIWTVANATMGLACVINAMRCGRLHCYFTGPLFILLALAAALIGVGVLPAGKETWNTLGTIFSIGTIVLYFVPEALFGRYVTRRTS